MARTDTLENYLTDVASAIKEKKGDSTPILASDFDTEIENLPSGGGVDINDYFIDTYSSSITGGNSYAYSYRLIKKMPPITIDNDISTCQNMFNSFNNLEEPPVLIGTSHVTNFQNMFSGCSKLKTINYFDVSAGTSFQYTFRNCTSLENLPVFNPIVTTSLNSMLMGCTSLTNDSLNNLLQTCINATRVTNANNKKLSAIFGGDMSTYYPASTIQSLSNYSSFTSAGWSIGW